MPNWCDNNVTIKATKDILDEITKLLTQQHENIDNQGPGFLAYCIPEPDYETTPVASTYPGVLAKFAETEEEKQEIMKNTPTIRKNSWYDWRLQNWGTKWEIRPDSVARDKDSITIIFDSAWSPPLEALDHLLAKEGVTSVTSIYCELGMDFTGKYDNGKVTDFAISELSQEDLKNNPIVSELHDTFGFSSLGT